MARFPSPEWVDVLMDKLNSDPKYAQVARNWEGDILFLVEPGGLLQQSIAYS
jgi:hypothetical protein